ncbi:MAG: LAGLIDADG family homing endonuclease [Patescibacteria group bacterium]|nr:LAGLIDADG family homing endonuclease [Patescibacteria group bacterium]
MFAVHQTKHNSNQLSCEYIRGFIESQGVFGFSTGARRIDGTKYKIPAFIITVNEQDRDFLEKIKNTLGFKNEIYIQKGFQKDGIKRNEKAQLIIRDFEQLKDIIIPLCYKKLKGNKAKQFNDWMEKLGCDQNVSERYKSLYRLYKWGVYNKPKFAELFK